MGSETRADRFGIACQRRWSLCRVYFDGLSPVAFEAQHHSSRDASLEAEGGSESPEHSSFPKWLFDRETLSQVRVGHVLPVFRAYPVGNLLKKPLCLLLSFFGEVQLLAFQYSLGIVSGRTEVQSVWGPRKT